MVLCDHHPCPGCRCPQVPAGARHAPSCLGLKETGLPCTGRKNVPSVSSRACAPGRRQPPCFPHSLRSCSPRLPLTMKSFSAPQAHWHHAVSGTVFTTLTMSASEHVLRQRVQESRSTYIPRPTKQAGVPVKAQAPTPQHGLSASHRIHSNARAVTTAGEGPEGHRQCPLPNIQWTASQFSHCGQSPAPSVRSLTRGSPASLLRETPYRSHLSPLHSPPHLLKLQQPPLHPAAPTLT